MFTPKQNPHLKPAIILTDYLGLAVLFIAGVIIGFIFK